MKSMLQRGTSCLRENDDGKEFVQIHPIGFELETLQCLGGFRKCAQYRQCEKDTLTTGGLFWCFSIPRAGGPTDRWFPHITVDVIYQSQLENKYGHCLLLGIVQS